MTRANFHFITRQGCFKFQGNSSCYPSEMIPNIFDFIKSVASHNSYFDSGFGFYDVPESNGVSTVIDTCGLTFGSVGNFCYVYEVDFVKQTLRIWDSRIYWVNAPTDWQAKGYHCYKGENGTIGYSNWRKGKLLYNNSFSNIILNVANDIHVSEKELEIAINCSN